MITWEQFTDGVDERFLSDVATYVFIISLVPEYHSVEYQEGAFNAVRSALLPVVEATEGLQLSSFQLKRVRPGSETKLAGLDDEDLDSNPFITLTCVNPVYDFQLSIAPEKIAVVKHRCSMEELILTVGVVEQLLSRLLSSGTPTQGSIAQPLNLAHRVIAVVTKTVQNVRLDPVLAGRPAPLNNSVMARVARFSDSDEVAPFVRLNPENVGRVSVKFSYTKTISDKERLVWLELDGPAGVQDRDMVLRTEFQTLGESRVLELADARDMTTGIDDFFRQIVLQRLYEDLFPDCVPKTRYG